MTRRTINVDGAVYCADVTGTLPGGMSIANAVAGACVVTPPPPPPGGAPPGRIVSSAIAYVPGALNPPYNRVGVDLQEYANLFGHASTVDDLIPFPGRANAQPSILVFPKTGYVALRFRMPAGFSPYRYGWISRQEYNYGQDLTSSISRTPGDFNPATAAEVIEGRSGQRLSMWRSSAAAANTGVILQPEVDYYYNLKMTDPSRPSRFCLSGASFCVIGLVNNVGGH
jgi:hypothetical protein